MVKFIGKIIGWLYPPFLRKAEEWLLVRHPGLWGIRLPALLFFGLLFNLIAVAIVWLYPLDLRSIPNYYGLALCAAVISGLTMLVWIVSSFRFDPIRNHGDSNQFSTRIRPYMYLLAVAIFLGPPGTLNFQFQIRIGNLAKENRVSEDFLQYQSYTDFLSGDEKSGNHTVFLESAIDNRVYTRGDLLTRADSLDVWKDLCGIEEKYGRYNKGYYSYEESLNRFNTYIYQTRLERERQQIEQMKKAPPSKMEQKQEAFRREIVENVHIPTSYHGYDPLSDVAKDNLSGLYYSVQNMVEKDWIAWFLDFALLGISAAFFMLMIDYAIRYLGAWYTVISLMASGMAFFLMLLISIILNIMLNPILSRFLGDFEGNIAYAILDQDEFGYLWGLPIAMLFLWFLVTKILRKGKSATFWIKTAASCLPGVYLYIAATMIWFLNTLLTAFSFDHNLAIPLSLFLVAGGIFIVGAPFLKKKYYRVYLLPSN